MSHARYLVGDVFDRMAELPDGSVDLILTSPPFLALRSYLPADHPDKSKEIGSEATPAEFVDTLLRLTAEWRRLLAPHGSLCIELGDTYSGSGGAGGDYGPEGLREGQPRFRQMPPNTAHRLHDDGSLKTDAETRRNESKNGGHVTPWTGGPGWPMAKSLALVPEAYRFALAYGINPHTGQESPAGRWRVRNVIRWVRPNPPVGALGDKFRPATSEMVVACVSGSRYFDLDSVREPWSANLHSGGGVHKKVAGVGPGRTQADADRWGASLTEKIDTNGGAPPLDWWKLSPGGYPGSHYAVWPAELCVKPIKAMSPERVCIPCGMPYPAAADRCPSGHHTDHSRPGLVLDPFAGSGTTLAVATGHGRDAIGIDLDSRNADLARERIGEFLEVVA